MHIDFSKRAQAQLDALERSARKLIARRIAMLVSASDFQQICASMQIRKLHGVELYRIRIGEWRVLFEHDTGLIYITTVGNRKDVYRDI